MRIVVLDGQTLNPGDLSWDAFKALGNLTVYDRSPEETVLKKADRAEVVITNKTPLNRELIRKLTTLKYIGVTATGFNVVNVEAAAKRNVIVTNVPGYSTASVAEHVFALLLSFARKVDHHADTVRKGRWSRESNFCYWNFPLIELSGLTMGIVGYGEIGRAVAGRALAFGMNVIVHTRTTPSVPVPGIRFVDMETVFRDGDIVSIHAPLTPLTENLVNADRLRMMKPSAFLINTSRGGLLDEEALVAVLKERKIAGAALDVMKEEPPELNHPLFRFNSCIITPHHAWAAKAARARCMKIAAENLAAFLAGKPQNIVSTPAS
jgi:glycerate dehydrogenase